MEAFTPAARNALHNRVWLEVKIGTPIFVSRP